MLQTMRPRHCEDPPSDLDPVKTASPPPAQLSRSSSRAVPSFAVLLESSLVLPRIHSGSASFTSPFIMILIDYSSTISLSFAHTKLHVLLLAGEGTPGSWIPGTVNLHILFRRCKKVIALSSICTSLRASSFLFWVWPILTIVGLLYSSLLLLGSVSHSHNLLNSVSAGSSCARIISSSIFLVMFIISNSSTGMERSIQSSSSLGERNFPHLPFSMRSGLFSIPKSMNFYNILTVLSSCGTTCTGSQDVTGFVSRNSEVGAVL
ncbi:unnamed protein product [Microthlaspi erraticum]|uniref:Uncharacterized protein n=1 Tax=Microthlaspi erraticum TaxID=1685480 RepID=A0A6D2IRP7_9BRAS|nr:unnamed protein product [Microthlaspi erraticum]